MSNGQGTGDTGNMVVGSEGWLEAVPESVRENAEKLTVEQLAGLLTPKSFQETLPEDLRGHELFKDMENPEALARAILEMKGKMPAIPEKAEDYKIQIPEEVETDGNLVGSFQKAAHDVGLSQDQAASMVNWFYGTYGKWVEDQYKEAQKAVAAKLAEKWGDDLEKNAETAKRFAELIDKKVEGFKAWVDQSGLGDNPTFLYAMYEMGKLISEDAFVEGGVPPEKKLPRRADGKKMLPFEGEPFQSQS